MNGNGINGNGFNGRDIRNVGHQKQNRMQIQEGPPDVTEMSEAVPVLRSVAGSGIVQYIKYNGDLYASVFTKNTGIELPQSSKREISRFHDGGAAGTAQQDWLGELGHAPINAIGGNWEDTAQDLSSLIGKIDEIIVALRRAGIIGHGSPFNSDGL